MASQAETTGNKQVMEGQAGGGLVGRSQAGITRQGGRGTGLAPTTACTGQPQRGAEGARTEPHMGQQGALTISKNPMKDCWEQSSP